jgi:large subunit ribosomal protein L20
MATESVDRAMRLATSHRRLKKRDYRSMWIARVSAACRMHGMNYSRLMDGLRKAGVAINRKMLSEIAIHDPEGFASVISQAQAVLK